MASESPFHRRLRHARCAGRPTSRSAASGAASTSCRACSRWRTCSAATPASIYAMRGEYETAAPFIGIAIVLDMLDGRIARMTGTTSEFGLQFDSLADVISFGMAPAILSFQWGLASLGRLGWARGVPVRDGRGPAAGALQHPVARPATSATSSGCRARRPRACRRRPCSCIPYGLHDTREPLCSRSRW